MKKRLMALICVALLTVGMTMTVAAAPSPAAAAPSPAADGIVTGVEKAVNKDNVAVEVVAENLSADQYATEMAYIKNVDNLKKELGTAYKDGMAIIDTKNVKVVGEASLIAWPVTITFTAKSIKATDDVVMLHYNETNKAWEVIKATVGDGTITGTFNSLSPVVFVKAGAATSPTTGEPISLMVAGAAVLMGAAGAVVSKKRK